MKAGVCVTMQIGLGSISLPSKVLEAAIPLIREFFVQAKVQILKETNTDVTVAGDVGTDPGGYAGGLDALISVNFNGFKTFEPVSGNGFDKPAITARWLGINPAGGYNNYFSSLQVESILSQPAVGREAPETLMVKLAVVKLLSEVTGRELPWGVLTGIRPSKLIHYWADRGVEGERRLEALGRRYGVRRDKARLLEQIVAVQEPYLRDMKGHPHHVAVYISIPFCPSRCSYCTFPGQIPRPDRTDVLEYLAVLKNEMAAVGEMMRRFELQADSLYLGGGTPTILGIEQLEELLSGLLSMIPQTASAELTVEAGRPDTLGTEKLALLHACGVSRLSINPQTMQQTTLERVGRMHTVAEVERVYQQAAALSGWIINMDLIIGLPGEGIKQVAESIARISALHPGNLTVHALALKRGSREWEQGYRHIDGPVLEQMQALVGEAARSRGLRPYYMYRQKQMAGNAENIGYALPGQECRYNIAIMEERQSVIGIGAGSSTKVVNPKDYSLRNLQHQTDWRTYALRWTHNHAERVAEFAQLTT